MNSWEFLGIAPTEDESLIKRAYLAKLPLHHPEEDPEGFKQLREAMEDALKTAKTMQQERENASVGQMMGGEDIRLFLKEAEELYRNFNRRIQPQQWQNLLSLPVCQDLESQKEAGWALLGFLMDHIHLPHSCYQVFDQFFGWLEDEEELYQHFPENFVRYLADRIQSEDSFRYALLPIREDFDYDQFCGTFFTLRRALNDHDKEAAEKAFAALEAMHMDHPDLTIQKIRHETMQQGHEQQAWGLAKALLAEDYDNPLTKYWYVFTAMHYEGSGASIEELEQLIHSLLEWDSESPVFWQLFGNLLRLRGDISQALRAYQKAKSYTDEEWESLDKRIEETAAALSVQMEQDPEFDDWWQLANVCWLAHRYDRVKQLLEPHTPDDDQKMSWLFLMGGSCHYLKEYQEAAAFRRQILDAMPPEERPLALYLDLAEDYIFSRQSKEALDIYLMAQEYFSGNPELCYRHARLLSDENQPEEAVKLCDKALEAGFHRDAFQLRLEILLELKDYQQVRQDAEQIIERGFRGAQVLYYLAQALRQLQEYEKAEELLKELNERTNGAGVVCQEYAALCSDTDRPEEALAWIEKALEQGDSPTLRYHKAEYLHDLKRYEEELAVYEELQTLGADNYYIHYCIGRAYKQLGRDKEAEQSFRRSLEHNSTYGITWDYLGDVLQNQGNWEEAAWAYENGWNNGNRQAIRDLCRLMKRTHQNERAEHFLKLGLNRYPDDPSLLWIQAIVLKRQKRYEDAVRCYNRYMEVKPSQTSSAYREIASVWIDAKDYARAEASFQKAIDYEPDNSKNWRLFGKYYANIRKMQEAALPYLEKAAELEPSSTYGWQKLGEVYEALGRTEDAVRCYETSLKNYQAELAKDPDDCCTCEGIADVLVHLNRLEEAEEMARRAISLQNTIFTCNCPFCYEALEDLAKAAERRGDLVEALAFMQKAGRYATTDHYPNEIERLQKALDHSTGGQSNA